MIAKWINIDALLTDVWGKLEQRLRWQDGETSWTTLLPKRPSLQHGKINPGLNFGKTAISRVHIGDFFIN